MNATWARSAVTWPVSGSSGAVRSWRYVRSTSTSLRPALELGQCVDAGQAHSPCGHPGQARCRGRAGRADAVRGRGRQPNVLGPQLGPGDLENDVVDALAELGCSAVHLCGEPAVRAPEPDPRRARVVEPLREADVLEADREAHPAPDALAAGRVARSAREADRVARELLGLRHRELGRAADHLRGRERAGHELARRQPVARPDRVQQAKLDRVDVERIREPVHLCLVREAALHGAEPPHRAAWWVVRVHARRLDQRVVDPVGPTREAGRVRGDRRGAGRVGAAVEQDPHADADELSGLRRPVLGPDLRRVPVDVADKRLLAAVDDLHGPVRVQREQRAVDLHREVLARPPNAPPTPERWIRTCSGSSPRQGATWSRSTWTHCVAT